ncbi:MAG: hypothetical protein WC508_01795 [Patescibacteria group bacterium]
MKYLNMVVIAAVLLVVMPIWAAEKIEVKDPAKLIPSIQIGDKLTLKLWGFAQAAYVESAVPDEFQWTNLRLLGNLDGQRIGLGFVFNFADLQHPNGNYVREFYGKIKLTDSLEARAGWLLTSVGNGEAFPGPPKIETVLFPRSLAYGQYGTGLQLRWNKELWSVVADVTGDTSLPFSDSGRFKNLEFSARLKRSFRGQDREVGYLGTSFQYTQTVNRFGFDGQWQPIKELTLRGGMFYSDYESQRKSNRFGGFLLAAYRPLSWFELHTMVDQTSDLSKEYEEIQKQKDKQGNITYKKVTIQTSDLTNVYWTNGIRFLGKNDRWSATLDYEMNLEDTKSGWLRGRLQVRF